MLPSQVLAQADTLDMWVFDVSASYRIKQQKQSSGDYRAGEWEAQSLDESTLLERMEKFRGKD